MLNLQINLGSIAILTMEERSRHLSSRSCVPQRRAVGERQGVLQGRRGHQPPQPGFGTLVRGAGCGRGCLTHLRALQRTQGCGPRPRRRPGAAVPAAALRARTPAAAVRPGRPPGRAPAGRPPAAGPGSRGAPVAGRPPPGSGPRGGGLPGARSPPSPRAHATRPGSTCVRAQVRRTPGAGTFPRCGLSTRPEAGIVGPSRRRGVEIRHTVRELVLWLLEVKNIFHFSQTTFNLALTTFSRLLVSLKMRERILQCVMITSLRLAAKVNEEEELIPHVKDFLKHYGSGYSPNELLRMELAILDKLHWDLYIGTPLDFLTIVSTRGWQSPL
ncbi:cyclin-I2 [Canis lupus baileyi]|uniref:cyclin-I2 n=1 Tax=Canis lupus baileyi TaxID=143281 RepID=UPI003B97C802